jgi:hypothetical protein
VLCVVVQDVESSIITPLIQRRVVALALVCLIAIPLIMFVLGGLFGLLLATPLAVVLMVLARCFMSRMCSATAARMKKKTENRRCRGTSRFAVRNARCARVR